jgi:hypothetical protein
MELLVPIKSAVALTFPPSIALIANPSTGKGLGWSLSAPSSLVIKLHTLI